LAGSINFLAGFDVRFSPASFFAFASTSFTSGVSADNAVAISYTGTGLLFFAAPVFCADKCMLRRIDTAIRNSGTIFFIRI
jgi:hypothetical protein